MLTKLDLKDKKNITCLYDAIILDVILTCFAKLKAKLKFPSPTSRDAPALIRLTKFYIEIYFSSNNITCYQVLLSYFQEVVMHCFQNTLFLYRIIAFLNSNI